MERRGGWARHSSDEKGFESELDETIDVAPSSKSLQPGSDSDLSPFSSLRTLFAVTE